MPDEFGFTVAQSLVDLGWSRNVDAGQGGQEPPGLRRLVKAEREQSRIGPPGNRQSLTVIEQEGDQLLDDPDPLRGEFATPLVEQGFLHLAVDHRVAVPQHVESFLAAGGSLAQ